jgi:hypothetical protein
VGEGFDLGSQRTHVTLEQLHVTLELADIRAVLLEGDPQLADGHFQPVDSVIETVEPLLESRDLPSSTSRVIWTASVVARFCERISSRMICQGGSAG